MSEQDCKRSVLHVVCKINKTYSYKTTEKAICAPCEVCVFDIMDSCRLIDLEINRSLTNEVKVEHV